MNTIELCITSKCNLSCKHCYQHNEKNYFELSLKQITEVLSFAIKKGATHIIISGGEACLHPQFYDIISHILTYPNLNITLVTNGTIIDTNFFINRKCSDRINFVISIDGNMKHHNDRRGAGTFEKTINTIKILQLNNFKVKINVTIDKENYLDIEEILENEDFKTITFLPVAYSGAAKLNNNTCNNKEYEEIIKQLYLVTESTNGCTRECKLYPKSISIKYDGSVYPCSLSRDFDILKMGNINDKSIECLITDFEQTSDGKKLLTTNLNVLEKCNKCKAKDNCSKGCRIRALKFNNNLCSPDPFACKLHTNKYKDISFNKLYWGEK